MEHESLSIPVSIITSEVQHLLKSLQGKITKFALIKVKNQLVKGLKEKQEGLLSQECSCFVKVWRLPCRHKLLECVESNGEVTLDAVYPRWHIPFINRNGNL